MSHRGRLLVATPLIEDPNFLRTVVVLLEHDESGALGVVLNRPSTTPVAEALPDWGDTASAPAVVFVGGPVAGDAILGLATCDPARTDLGGFDHVVGPGFGTLDLHEPPTGAPHQDGVRLFAGAAGWSSGQLEDEIDEGAWWIVDAEPADIATADPSTLWERVLRRQRNTIGWFANCPLDPTTN